jgi:hypothetical protein
MSLNLQFSFSFEGALTDDHLIDLYDISEALSGFQRSLAITTHLILNDQVITQAPSLKNARIFAGIPQDGSWKIITIVSAISYGAYTLGTAPKDTVIGNLIVSAYDYVLKESLGIHVDFNSTIGQQLEKLNAAHVEHKPITPEKMDSVIEKCENSIIAMHRPVVKSETANRGVILYPVSYPEARGQQVDSDTYLYISESTEDRTPIELVGKVSSYNINTYKGRIFRPDHRRPISFVIADFLRERRYISLITSSLNANALDRNSPGGYIKVRAYRILAPNGRLKSLILLDISTPSESELNNIITPA